MVLTDSQRFAAGSPAAGRPRPGADSLALDLAQPQDRLDPGDLALGLDDLAGGLEPLGLALEPEAEQVVLDFLEQQLELLVGLVAKFGGLGHRLESPLKPWAGG